MFRMPVPGLFLVFVLNALLQQHLVGQRFIVMVYKTTTRVPISWEHHSLDSFHGPTRRMLSFQLCVFSFPKLLTLHLIVTPVGLGWCMVDQTSRYRTLRYETEIATYRRRRSGISLSLLRTPSLQASRFYLYLFNAGHNIPWYLTLDIKLPHSFGVLRWQYTRRKLADVLYAAHGMSLLHCKKLRTTRRTTACGSGTPQSWSTLSASASVHAHKGSSSHDPTNNLAMIPDTLLSDYPARLGCPYYCTRVSICFCPPCPRPRFHNLWRPIALCSPRIILISVQQ